MTEKRVDVEKLKEAIRNHAENQRRDGQEYPAWVHERTVFMLIDSLAQPVEIDSDRITGAVRKFVNDELYTYDVPVEGDEESYTVVVNAICKLFYSLVQPVEQIPVLPATRRLLVVMNKVTACHRHGTSISKEALDEMSNAQIDAEEEIKALGQQSTPVKTEAIVECKEESMNEIRRYYLFATDPVTGQHAKLNRELSMQNDFPDDLWCKHADVLRLESENVTLKKHLREIHTLAHNRPTKDILPIIHRLTEQFHEQAKQEAEK